MGDYHSAEDSDDQSESQEGAKPQKKIKVQEIKSLIAAQTGICSEVKAK